MAGIRDYGYVVGTLPTGPRNLISDVAGVRVGHATVDEGRSHTGVTVILPTEGNVMRKRPVAASYVLNGFGKTIGTVQLDELGCLETPIALTNTLCASRVADALITRALAENLTAMSVNPLVGETNDYRINDIRTRVITERHVEEAFANACEDYAQGSVGAGRATVCFGLKGGIGSASRVVHACGQTYTLGVLVQSNFGVMEQLRVCGQPVGKRISKELHDVACAHQAEQGSVMVVVATDAPLTSRQVRRVIKRAGAGLARTGSCLGNGSGDVFLGFSTGNLIPARSRKPITLTCLPDDTLDQLFVACIEATEEAVLSSLVNAEPDVGLDGTIYHSLSEFL